MSTAPRSQAVRKDWGHDESGCTFLHVDMDAFFASLETARHPELVGRPVIVGGVEGTRGVVSTANYEARRYGVHSAQAMATARRLCPQGAFLPVDHHYYSHVSHEIFTQIVAKITDQIEQVSVDEAYINVAPALREWKSPRAIGEWIRQQVYQRFHITCSVGIGSNMLMAKLASTNAKPNGLLLVPQARNAEFVRLLDLRAINGVGPALEKRLSSWAVTTVAQIQEMSEAQVVRMVGSRQIGHWLWLACQGESERVLVTHAPEKSIGQEMTFPEDTNDLAKIRALLRNCCDHIARRLREKQLVARTVSVKIRFADLTYATRSQTSRVPIQNSVQMMQIADQLLPAALAAWKRGRGVAGEGAGGGSASGEGVASAGASRGEVSADAGRSAVSPTFVRLAGVSVSGLTEQSTTLYQPELDFDDTQENNETALKKNNELEKALDAVRARYGFSAVRRGATSWRDE